MEFIINTSFFIAVINTLLIMKINRYVECHNNDNDWDILEWFFVTFIFGWLGLVYILIEYSTEVFGSCDDGLTSEEAEEAEDDER